MKDKDNIPIIDFTKCGLLVENDDDVENQAIHDVGVELYQAFSIYGFARLSNTGMPSEIIRGVNRRSKEFYHLSEDAKSAYSGRSMGLSYDPRGSLKVNKYGTADQSEGLMVGSPAMYDENTRWPHVPELKESMLTCADMCRKLTHRLFKALGVGMKLKDPDYFYKCHSFLNQKGNATYFKATHYPAIPDHVPVKENSTRIGEHTDAGSITLLFHDDVGGLQIKNSNNEFINVEQIPGMMLVNIGDQLQFWSGFRLKSTVHRVLTPKTPEQRKHSRQVVIYFASADYETPLDELEFADGVEDKAKKSHEGMKMTSIEYIRMRFYDIRPASNTV